MTGGCASGEVAEEVRVSQDLSHIGPGRSWEVATTLIIIAAITFHPLLSPTGPPSLDAAIQHALAGLYPLAGSSTYHPGSGVPSPGF